MTEHDGTITTVAALDLGSNSFHLLVAAFTADGWQPRLRLGERVQLAAGLQGGRLSDEAQARGLECLRGLMRQLQPLAPSAVKVIGTYALRTASNSGGFAAEVERIVGQPLEIVTGEREAELIYRGAAGAGRQLVIDIGGGSTELALGSGDRIHQLASVSIGCITQLEHFPGGALSPAHFERAHGAACARIRAGWRGPAAGGVATLGCSGTLRALAEVLQRHSWGDGGIDRAGLLQLKAALLGFDHLEAVRFEGLSENRCRLLATGLAITLALFDTLGIERMTPSPAALREGVVEELWRARHGDTRVRQVAS